MTPSGSSTSDHAAAPARRPARPRPARLADVDPDPARTPDRAQRAARRAAGARRHRRQHRQRQHRRLFARDRGPPDQPDDRRSRRSPRSPARAPSSAPASTSRRSRRIRNSYLDAQYRTQNSALSDAEHAGGSAAAGAERLQRTVELRASRASSRRSGAPGASLSDSPTQRSGQAGRRRRRRAARRLVQRTQRAADDDLHPGRQNSTKRSPGRPAKSQDDANQIAQLNGQIKLAEEAGQQPNSDARPPRPADRQALLAGPGHRHRSNPTTWTP